MYALDPQKSEVSISTYLTVSNNTFFDKSLFNFHFLDNIKYLTIQKYLTIKTAYIFIRIILKFN